MLHWQKIVWFAVGTKTCDNFFILECIVVRFHKASHTNVINKFLVLLSTWSFQQMQKFHIRSLCSSFWWERVILCSSSICTLQSNLLFSYIHLFFFFTFGSFAQPVNCKYLSTCPPLFNTLQYIFVRLRSIFLGVCVFLVLFSVTNHVSKERQMTNIAWFSVDLDLSFFLFSSLSLNSFRSEPVQKLKSCDKIGERTHTCIEKI